MLLKKLLDPGIDSRLYNRLPNDDARKKDGWRIGKLAAACGVSPDTLRHYERKGVLKAARSANGYRQYPEEAFVRVQLVRRALAMLSERQVQVLLLRQAGLTYAEIAVTLEVAPSSVGTLLARAERAFRDAYIRTEPGGPDDEKE